MQPPHHVSLQMLMSHLWCAASTGLTVIAVHVLLFVSSGDGLVTGVCCYHQSLMCIVLMCTGVGFSLSCVCTVCGQVCCVAALLYQAVAALCCMVYSAGQGSCSLCL
jgi:hypothetical protein